MLRYDYACENCGIYEVKQRITESVLQDCIKCGFPVHRVISTPEFLLKGEGWPGKTIKRDNEKERIEGIYQERMAAQGMTPAPLAEE